MEQLLMRRIYVNDALRETKQTHPLAVSVTRNELAASQITSSHTLVFKITKHVKRDVLWKTSSSDTLDTVHSD